MRKIIRKSITLVIVMALILTSLPSEFCEYMGITASAWAATSEGDEFSLNGLDYVVLSDNISVKITGGNDNTITELVIPETVQYDNYDFSVVEIAYRAFAGYSRLTNVEMGNNVTTLGNYAFEECKSLTSVNLSDNLKNAGYRAFENCTRLENILIPKSLTGTAEEMFSGCSTLSNIEFEEGVTTIPAGLFKNTDIVSFEFPETVVNIGKMAFENCEKLESIRFPQNLEYIGGEAFRGCTGLTEVNLPKTLKKMEYSYGGSFVGCTSLKKVWIPKSLTEAQRAFESCNNLKEIEWEEGVTQIPDSIFEDCEGIESVVIPSTITKIEAEAFYGCKSLKEIEWGGNEKEFGVGAFRGCTGLTELTLPKSLEKMDCDYYGGSFKDCTGLKKVWIPKTLTEAQRAFENCNELKEIEWEEGSTQIPDSIFEDCGGLESVVIPATITKIEAEAFYGCKSLKEIEWGGNEKEFGVGAFRGCTGLTELTLPKSLEKMDCDYYGGSFKDCTGLKKVWIPKALTEAQRAFESCNNLKEIEWEEGVTQIPDSIFEDCEGIESVVIPSTITKIEAEAFYGCKSLKEIEWGENEKEFGVGAFRGCTGLTELTLPKSLEKMDCDYYGGSFKDCTGLKKVWIPKTLTEAKFAFENCSSLKEVKWETGIDEIPVSMFENCSGLESMTVPETVVKIKDGAFENCASLKEVYLPDSIKEIAENAFNECPYLVLKMSRDTHASRYAIQYKWPFEWIGNEVLDNGDEFLEKNSCLFETSTQGATANGYINFCIEYGFESGIRNSVSDIRIQIYVPEGVTVVQESININNVQATEFEMEDNFLEIPVQKASGVIKFSVEASAYDAFYSYAGVKYTKSNVGFYELIGVLNAELEPLSLNMDDETDSATFGISGIAIPDKEVEVFIDGKKYTTVKGTKAGTYATPITIDGIKKFKTYSIKVVSTNEEGVAVESTKTITYRPEMPQIQEFSMKHNGQTYSLLEQKGLKPIVVFNPSADFEFEAKFSNPKEIETVYFVSNRSNVKKQIEALWDEEKQAFVAKGYFDNQNHNYVPGTIMVEYISKGDKQYLNSAIDFSSEESVNSVIPEFEDANVTINKDTEDEWKATITLPNLDNTEICLNYTSSELSAEMTEEELENLGYVRVPEKYIEKNQQQLNALDFDLSEEVIAFVKFSASPITDEIETEIVDFAGKKIEKLTMGGISEGTLEGLGEAWGWYNDLQTYEGYRVDLKAAKRNIQNSSMSYAEKETALKHIDTANKMNNGKIALKMLGTMISVAGFTANPIIGLSLGAMTMLYDNELGTTMLDIRDLSSKTSGSAEINFRWAIDPSGYVYDAESGERIAGAIVTLYYKSQENAEAILWKAEEYLQQNPLCTAADGTYAWDVPEGFWQVKCEKEGYETAYSEWLQVPPPQTEVNIGMKKKEVTVESNPLSTSQPTQNTIIAPTPTPTVKPAEKKEEASVAAPSKVKKVTVKSPKKKTMKVSWKKVSGASGYQIQYATNKKFTKKVKSKVLAKTKKTIKKLKRKKTYYVRVRAYRLDGKTKVYGKWSKSVKVKIK